MRRSIALSLALAAATLATPAWAAPGSDDRGADAPAAACGPDARGDEARTGCTGETGVIDHLPDSFFVGGGGVGSWGVGTGGSDHVWVHAVGEAFAGARVSASARASVSIRVQAHARR